MGLRGPAPYPTAVNQALGRWTPGKEAEPRFAEGAPEMPRWLSKRGKREWKRLVPMLLSVKGLLTEADGAVLAMYCQDLGVMEELQVERNKLGPLVEGANGEPVANPLDREIDRVSARLLQRERELGMTPSARSRIRVDATAKAKPSSGPLAVLSRKSA